MSRLPIDQDIVSGAFERAAWHGRGTVLGRTMSVQEAIVKGGLDWNVVKRPIVIDGQTDEDFVATVREDTGQRLGIVTTDYKEIQNREAFSAVEALVEEGVEVRAAVVLDNSKCVALTAKLPENVVIDPDGIADETEMNLFTSTRHDGNGSQILGIDPTVIVCMNTNQIAIKGAEAANRIFRIQHRANANARIEEARKALGLTLQYAEAYGEAMTELVKFGVSDKAWSDFLDNHFAPVAKDTAPAAVIANSHDKREILNAIWNGETIGQNDRCGKNAYGLLNAVTEYLDHFAPTKAKTSERDSEIRLERIASSQLQKATQPVFNLLTGKVEQAKDARRRTLTFA